jgi:hypothetical protein
MTTLTAALIAVLGQTPAAAPIAPAPMTPAQQIAAAVQAAPEERRADATVLGYDATGAIVTLRQGKGDLVCLADNPKDSAFEVDCYQKDLEPFMARGRALSATGLKGKERNETRWQEIESGKLAMPKEPRTLYILEGKGYDAATGAITKPYRRWVVYTPYATPESTGLSTMPVPGGPWLMFPGKPTAHIMINPPQDDK